MIKFTNSLSLAIIISIFSLPTFAEHAETTLTVSNMDCVTCPVVVRAALYDLEGVSDVQVSMEKKTVSIKYDNEKHTKIELAKAVTNAGFPAEVEK